MKEDSWSKSIIAVAHRRQHQAYQHRSASVMAAVSHSGMCTRHYLSSGSILRHFVQRGQWLCQTAVMFVATEFCLSSFSLFFLLLFALSHVLPVSPFLLPVSAAIIHNRNVNLRGDAAGTIAFIHMPTYIPGSLYWRLRQPLHTALCIKSIQIQLGIFH